MSNFALVDFDAVKGAIRFFKLQINGTCQFDEFCQQIKAEGNLEKELKTMIARLDQVANRKSLPSNKIKNLTPAKDLVKEYEIKTKHLRLYFIKDDSGHLIILAGKKNTQSSDIKEFRSIKKRYLESIKATK